MNKVTIKISQGSVVT